MNLYTIGALAKATGCSVATIRYYERIGLLPEADRSAGNQRRYGDEAAKRLRFARHTRELGFSLEEVAEILRLADSGAESCDRVHEIASARLAEVERKLSRLELLRGELKSMIACCRADAGLEECGILEILGDHRLCHHEHLPD
jgi:DNA-binding transcriptional MerR regulator